MKKIQLSKKDTALFRTGKILLINIALLGILLLLFTPAEKIDDYRLKFILAGAATGQSDGHLLQYSNFFLGKILQTLTTWVHALPWYEVTQYIALFASFCVLVYFIQKRKLGTAGNAIMLILLAIFGYEAYIKLTFSKTAGIACAAGLFLLFSVLYETSTQKGDLKKKENIIKLVVSLLLIVVGALLRYRMWELMLAVSIVYLLFRFICDCVDVKRDIGRITIKRRVISLSRTAAVCLALFCCLYGVNKVGTSSFSTDEEWNDYRVWNSLKVNLQDYGWPDYEAHKEEYEELGIDQAMYDLWYDRDYSDPEYFTTQTMRDIISLKSSSGNNVTNKRQEIVAFFKEFPNRFLNEICIWAILPLIAYWCLSKQRYKKVVLVVSFVMIMLLNYYQYTAGRYDQHQVNVGIWFAFALIYIGCMSEATEYFKNCKISVALSLAFLMFFAGSNYEYLASNSYYGAGDNRTVSTDQVKRFLELASQDNEHLYICSYSEMRYGFMGYSVLEQIPAGLYHNIYNLEEYMYPTSRISLENYGIYNVYREMVNSDVIYYYKSDDVSTVDLNQMVSYIQDLYNSNAYSSLIKRFDGFSVYGFLSDEFQLDAENIVDISPGEEEVLSDVALSITLGESEEDDTPQVVTEVDGYLYKAESNSFNQRVYLEICHENGDIDYQVVTTCENDATNDIMNGAYGQIYGSYISEPSDWDQNAAYNIILECDDGMYRLPLEVNID